MIVLAQPYTITFVAGLHVEVDAPGVLRGAMRAVNQRYACTVL
jgi:hypothetical protein